MKNSRDLRDNYPYFDNTCRHGTKFADGTNPVVSGLVNQGSILAG